MAKRAGSELNHLNWDKLDDEKEEAGTFKPLSETQLQNRVIKRAKRTLSPGEHNSGSPATGSPFSAFMGFSKSSSKPMFSFQPQESKASNASNTSNTPDQKPQNGQESSFKPVSEPPKESTPSTQPPVASQPKVEKSDLKSVEYFRQLQSLNESVLKWMQLHIAKNPCCDFTPVFKDYKNHLRKLEQEYPVPSGAERKPSLDSSRNALFKMPQSSASSGLRDKSSPKPSKSVENPWKMFKKSLKSHKKELKYFVRENQKSFGEKSSESAKTLSDSEMPYGAHFASNTTNTSTFSFGIKQSPTSMTTGSKSGSTMSHSSDKGEEEEEVPEKKEPPKFSFGWQGSTNNSSSTQNSGTSTFRFASSAVSSSTDKEKNCNDETEEYVPPKNEFTAVTEEDALYSKRCKLFYKKGNEYAEKGVGTLFLKPLDGKTQLLMRADTALGNILLNILLSESLPMERMGKNNVLIVCVPHPPIDPNEKDTKKSIPLLIRVKTAEDADELYEKLNECKS